MALSPGTKLGTYEILALIGAGGMGEVYRARDSKLKREVAIKVLPEGFSRDTERVARFQREAEVLASVNHPHIAAIYDLEEFDNSRFLILELVEGETLADRIKRGRIPLAESLGIAAQILEALEAAHERGVIHRDLKPGNVKITPDGMVKLLDFGLAKALKPEQTPTHLSNSPTLSMAATQQGMILGTAAYMSPEQANGLATDRRTDIFSFGSVFYEMLTGHQAFQGQTVTEVLAAVLKTEPDWDELPDETPTLVRHLLRRCLQKEQNRRSRDATEIRLQLEDATDAKTASPLLFATQSGEIPSRARHVWMAYSVTACLVAASIAGIAVWNLRPDLGPRPQPVARLTIPLPTGQRVPEFGGGLALSGDGTQLTFVAGSIGRTQLYVRAMNSAEVRPLPGSDNASHPFFSPDGQWIGFFAGPKLQRVSVNGGAIQTLYDNADNTNVYGASWGPNNTIVFASRNSGLYEISASGGAPHELTKLKEGEESHRWPQFLPNGDAVLFTVSKTATNQDDWQIAVQEIGADEPRVLIQGGTDGRYVPTGHLVYLRAGIMLAVPFDLERLEVVGTPTPIIENIMTAGVTGTGQAGDGKYTISNMGSLAYIEGSQGGQAPLRTMVWVDRKGVTEPLAAPPRAYKNPQISPDGRAIAVLITQPAADIWVYDPARDALNQFTFDGSAESPHWSPDGKRLAYESQRSGPYNLFWKLADGSSSEERLTMSEYIHQIGSFSPDGQNLIYAEIHPKTKRDIWILPLEGERKPRLFLQTPFNESTGRLSPDGRWLAYISDETGRYEVYVRPFPGPGEKRRISTEGGNELAWSPRGGELFYRVENQMMAVDIDTEPTFTASKPRMLFEGAYIGSGGAGIYYSVSPDGQRFLMLKEVGESDETPFSQIHIVLNWFEELTQLVPVP